MSVQKADRIAIAVPALMLVISAGTFTYSAWQDWLHDVPFAGFTMLSIVVPATVFSIIAATVYARVVRRHIIAAERCG